MYLFFQIHDGLLVHASDANTSQRRRCGFVIRYVPTYAYPTEVRDNHIFSASGSFRELTFHF